MMEWLDSFSRSGSLLLALAAGSGCGPSNAVDEMTGTSSSESSSGAVPADTSTESGSTSSPADTSRRDDATTEEVDPCAGADPIDGCPNGCMDVVAYLGTGDDLDTSSTGLRMCIARGDDIAGGYRSAWWSDIDGDHRFLVAGHGCGLQLQATPTDEWRECGTTPDEPVECPSLCAQDVCPGEQDWMALTSCDVPTPCPAVQTLFVCEPDEALICVHTALADRVPGRYDVAVHNPNHSTAWIIVVAADGSVQVVSNDNDTTVCHSVLDGIWQSSETCTLADPAFFAACADAKTWCGGDGDACQGETLSGWLTGCEPTPPSCP